MLLRSLTTASSSGVSSASLPTGVDSPVSGDSSTCRPLAETNRISAGIAVPASIRAKSPGTSSAESTVLRSPPRTTRVFVRIISCSGAALGAAFLQGADDRVDGEHGEDERRVVHVADGQRYQAGDQQYIDQRILELAQEYGEQAGAVFLR